MKSTLLLASIAIAATASTSLMAAERPADHRHTALRSAGYDHGMQVVSNLAGPGEPGDGWRYFSDPAAARAVVISPQGEYYLNRGKGLRLVADRSADHRHTALRTAGYDHGMQIVPNLAGPGEPGDGWRYFSDAAAAHAVVISPQGDYYHSRGKGLMLVAVTQPGD